MKNSRRAEELKVVEYAIWCNECGDLLDASHISASEARRLAREAGRLLVQVLETALTLTGVISVTPIKQAHLSKGD